MVTGNEIASIIIVTYNSQKYLESCLNSIHNQKYPYEVIIVDNCSQDNTIEYVQQEYR